MGSVIDNCVCSKFFDIIRRRSSHPHDIESSTLGKLYYIGTNRRRSSVDNKAFSIIFVINLELVLVNKNIIQHTGSEDFISIWCRRLGESQGDK